MKYRFVLERKELGKWDRPRDVNGIAIVIEVTKEQAAWINQSCNAEYRWMKEE